MLDLVKIILTEPKGPLNVGSIARIMKNMGLHRLVLVNPQCDHLSHLALQMAVHAQDILEQAEVVDNLATALTGCTKAIATTGVDHTLPLALETPDIALSWLIEDHHLSALIFGREDHGLTKEELNIAQKLIQIPTNPEYPSLNLAQAVGICCYELSKIVRDVESSSITPPSLDQSASLDQLENYYQELENLLLVIGYLYPHTAKSRMYKLRHIYKRANITPSELAMLRGIIRQVKWSINFNSEIMKDDSSSLHKGIKIRDY